MGAIITTSATMMCPHGGSATGTVAGAPRATAGGSQTLTVGDTFLISGCPLNISGAPHPCVEIQWIMGALKVTADGNAILTDSAQGLCLAADKVPQGPPTLMAAQTKAVAT
jgi:hypothetical protein